MLETELKYIKSFSDYVEQQKVITFKDYKLVDMYMHNFIFVKELMRKDELRSFMDIDLTSNGYSSIVQYGKFYD